jgi:hypothetical protein
MTLGKLSISPGSRVHFSSNSIINAIDVKVFGCGLFLIFWWFGVNSGRVFDAVLRKEG